MDNRTKRTERNCMLENCLRNPLYPGTNSYDYQLVEGPTYFGLIYSGKHFIWWPTYFPGSNLPGGFFFKFVFIIDWVFNGLIGRLFLCACISYIHVQYFHQLNYNTNIWAPACNGITLTIIIYWAALFRQRFCMSHSLYNTLRSHRWCPLTSNLAMTEF